MIEFQRLLLDDTLRNNAFVNALKAVVVPGKSVVADIGSGTGFLSFAAEKMGAKECHLYEVSELLTLSKALAKENGMKHCQFFQAHSTDVKKPVKADVVVSEILGNYALEENIIETLNDAQRFLKPGGTIIPESLTQFVAPVTSSRLYDELNVWDRVGHGMTFDAAKEICMNNMYVKEITMKDIQAPSPGVYPEPSRGTAGEGWGEGRKWDAIDFRKKNDSVRTKTIEWIMTKDMTLYGYALWWESVLTKKITLSTSPSEPMTHWKQIYLPLLDPLPVKKGQMIQLTITSDSRYEVKINVTWETTIFDAAAGLRPTRARQRRALKNIRQDMTKGFL